MLLKLSGQALRPIGETSSRPFVGRIASVGSAPDPERGILRLREGETAALGGFRGYLFDEATTAAGLRDAYTLGPDWRYVAEGDIVRIDPARRSLSVLYRRSSPFNAFLVTERCDNFCVMCSQPPKERDDSWLVDELEEVIPLVSPDTREIGITGGEPGLLGGRLIDLIARLKQHLPTTAVHVLSNGRAFADRKFAEALAGVRHPDLMLGIPLYSDIPEEHDYVVQAHGAFDETIRGILNLKRARVRVELRVVIHSATVPRLPDLARFITRNLLFVDHVALMGLELMGFAKTNVDELWIDPLDYQQQLVEAVRELRRARLHVSLYNHQLCVLPQELHGIARRSISDWKNRFFDECGGCSRRDECGGFFASATVRCSRGISPFT